MRFVILLSVALGFLDLASAGTPVCESNRNCPGWMAQLVTNVPSVCSSFLVRPDIMITNRHCLPNNLRQAGRDCSSLQFFFPRTPQYAAAQVRCSQVLETSDALKAPLKWIADVAVLKLQEPLSRQPLEISYDPIKAAEQIEVFKIDPAPLGKSTPVLRKIQCEAAPALMNLFFTHDPSPELTLLRCPVISGNSGSPLINSKGQAVGILWGSGGEAQPKGGGPSFQLAVGNSFECFRILGAPSLASSSRCQENLPPKILTALEKDYRLGRNESAQEMAKKTQLAKRIEESFALLDQKFQAEMKKTEASSLRGLFGWIAKESALKEAEKKFLWGRYILIPYCVHLQHLKAHIEEQQLSSRHLRLRIPIPSANLVRVIGEPDLYFSPLMSVKDIQISSDLDRQPASDKIEFSYQIESSPQNIELSVVKIPECR